MAHPASSSDTSGHRSRLRERVLQGGIDSMPDYELLELLLSYAIPRGDTKPLAKRLLASTTLGGLLLRDPQELELQEGLGPHSISLLVLVRRLHQELVLETQGRLEFLFQPAEAVPWLRSVIGLAEEERFAAIYLDQGRRILGREVFDAGSRTRTVLYPRRLFEQALRHKATGIVLAHNHPGGSRQASAADRNLTQSIARLGEGLEIELVDHLIVTRDGHSSFREQGLL
jgi:DNA repair protein RadC